MRLAFSLILLAVAMPALAMHCELDGVEVNTDNGATTAGKTGMLRCYRPDGKLQREQALRQGDYLGLDRRYDDDGSVRERQVNARGNTEGRATETYPTGRLKSEGNFSDGSAVGLHKSFHPDGKPAALRYYEKAGAPAAATMEFTPKGQLSALRCGTHPMLGEDRGPCGFDGTPVEVQLFDRSGALTAKRTMQNGKVLSTSDYDRSGRMTGASETTTDGRIERRFHDNGQLAAEIEVAHEVVIVEREWYMNGQPKSRITREPVEGNPKSTVERYRDDGVLASRSEALGRRTLHLASFDEHGRPKEEFDYDDDGRLRRHRAYGPDGALTVDEELYPDGSRKSLLPPPKIAR